MTDESVVRSEAMPPCTCKSLVVIAADRHEPDCKRRLWIERDEAWAEVERLRCTLENLMKFGERLMVSDVMEERAIGCCICEGARIVREDSS